MIMTNLRLSAHFTLAEFERSATAARLGLSTREVLDREAKALGLLRNAEK